MNAQALVDQIFNIALEGGSFDVDTKTRTTALWVAGIVLLADVLLRADDFNRERLLRGLERELRAALSARCRHAVGTLALAAW